MSDKMYFPGVLPKKLKDPVVLQVVNAAHGRS